MEILTWQARTDRHLTLKQLHLMSRSPICLILNINDKLCADNASDTYFPIYGNNWKRSFIPIISMIQSRQEKGGKPMIRKRINTLLNKLSDAQLKRIYKYIKYVYIHG